MRRGLSVASVALITALLLAYLGSFYHDDAYIALRYAEHWVAGLGLVWNPGERVEGYTSLLSVVLTGGLHGLGMGLVAASRVVGLAAFAFLVIDLLRWDRHGGRLSAALVATSGPLIAWALGGLETLLFTALLTAAVLRGAAACANGHATARSGAWLGAGLLLAAAQLCRPEAALVALVLALFVARERRRASRPHARVLLRLLLPVVIALVSHGLFRQRYYGAWLPNTAHAKAGVSLSSLWGGLQYVGLFVAAHALLLRYWLLGLRRGRRSGARDVAALLWVTGVYTGYVIGVGGDHMPWFRFMLPVLPLVVVVAARGLASGARPGLAAAAVIAYGLLSVLAFGELGPPVGWKRADPAAYRGAVVGKYIRAHWPRDALVALNTAGSTAFYSGLRAIDMLGLNDRHIARTPARSDPALPWSQVPGHRKGDGGYVLARRPDFIILGGSEGSGEPWFVGDKQILADPGFRQAYRRERVGLRAPDGVAFDFTFFRRVAP